MEASIRSVFATHFKTWAQGRRLPLHYHKAAFALGHCRISAMGTHVQRCEQGHYAVVQPNACRSRSCPRCASLARERWVMSQPAKLLACDHYHVVFILPHELLPWFASHRRLMALHTWGRNLSHHPRVDMDHRSFTHVRFFFCRVAASSNQPSERTR